MQIPEGAVSTVGRGPEAGNVFPFVPIQQFGEVAKIGLVFRLGKILHHQSCYPQHSLHPGLDGRDPASPFFSLQICFDG